MGSISWQDARSALLGAVIAVVVQAIFGLGQPESWWADLVGQDGRVKKLTERHLQTLASSQWRDALDDLGGDNKKTLVKKLEAMQAENPIKDVDPHVSVDSVDFRKAIVSLKDTQIGQEIGCVKLNGIYTLKRSGGFLGIGGHWKITAKATQPTRQPNQGSTVGKCHTAEGVLEEDEQKAPLELVTRLSSSETLPDDGPERLLDTGPDQRRTAWRDDRFSDGAWFELHLAQPAPVVRVDIYNGLGTPRDPDWNDFERAEEVTVTVDGRPRGPRFWVDPQKSGPQQLRYDFGRISIVRLTLLGSRSRCAQPGITVSGVALYTARQEEPDRLTKLRHRQPRAREPPEAQRCM